MPTDWHVSGSYYEVCNCEAICPCRNHGDHKGGRATYDSCDFALSWHITEGKVDTLDLSGLSVVMAGSYGEVPKTPWYVILYVDERASKPQHEALASIFLGRSGGTTLHNFAGAIGEVYAVKSAKIELDHTPRRQRMSIAGLLSAAVAKPVETNLVVTCGIPGYDHPGQESVATIFKINDDPLNWEVKGRCGFATDFDYRS